MLTPIKVSTKSECIKRMNNLLHSKSDTALESSEQISELTKETFKSSTDYRVVYKNFDYTKTYDTWIYEGNDKDKIVGYKYLQSYPYDAPQFKIGDYIHWNFNHKELSTWILISLDTEYLYNVKGRMLQCNNSLRWKDNNGELNCYPCAIEDALTYTNFKWGSKGVVEDGGDIVVIVQKNKYTSKINVNDRFMFNEVTFRVKQIFNELNPNYVELYMAKVPILEDDQSNKNLAINERPEQKVFLQGNIILPDISEILSEDTQDFNVYNYENSENTGDGFFISASGVPNKFFELSITDGNNFTIKNLIQYQINPLKIKCVNKRTGDIVEKEIWLGGNW